jgi:dipeptidyl-peptidase III
MARAGLVSLEFWDPKTKKWGQAHMQARYSILKVLLSTSPPVVTFTSSKDDHTDLQINLDRSLINSHGKKAIGEYLRNLHVYKSTADVVNGTKFYQDATEVTEELAKYREVVLKLKQPRRQFVQANTFVKEDGSIECKEYEATVEGLLKSFVEREV